MLKDAFANTGHGWVDGQFYTLAEMDDLFQMKRGLSSHMKGSWMILKQGKGNDLHHVIEVNDLQPGIVPE